MNQYWVELAIPPRIPNVKNWEKCLCVLILADAIRAIGVSKRQPSLYYSWEMRGL